MVGAPRILVVGDSISQGSAGDFTWRYRLHQHLVRSGVRPAMVGVRRHLFDNVADSQDGPDRMAYAAPFDDVHAGHAALWGQRASEKVTEVGAEVSSTQPDVALVLMGINDVVAGSDPTPALRQIVVNARSAKPDLTIVVGTLVPTEIEVDPERADVLELVRRTNLGILAIRDTMSTTRSPILVAETRPEFDPRLHTYDGVHPNSGGEVRIAAAFADALADLGVGGTYPRPLADPPLGPRTPPILTASRSGDDVTLTWSKVPGALQYDVHSRDVTTDADAAWVRRSEPFDWDDRSLTLRLVPGHTVEYAVCPHKGLWSRGGGAWSNTVRLTA